MKEKKYDITVSWEEAALVDWLLTMHGFDQGQLDFLYLKLPLRKKVAPGIVYQEDRVVSFSIEDITYLLAACPITFRFTRDDVGFSLKCKLLKTQIPPKLEIIEEKPKEGGDARDRDASQGQAEDSESRMPRTGEGAVSAGEDMPGPNRDGHEIDG